MNPIAIAQLLHVSEYAVMPSDGEHLSLVVQVEHLRAKGMDDVALFGQCFHVLQHGRDFPRVRLGKIFVRVQKRNPFSRSLFNRVVLGRRKVVTPIKMKDLRPHLFSDFHRLIRGTGVHHDLLPDDAFPPRQCLTDVLLLVFYNHTL